MVKQNVIRIGILINFILNSLNLILGVIYVLVQSYQLFWSILWHILGVSLFGSFILNLFFTLYVAHRCDINIPQGRRINYLSYVLLIIQAIGALLMGGGNFFYGNNYPPTLASYWPFLLMIYGGYFGIIIIGLIFSLILLKSLNQSEIWYKEHVSSDLGGKKSKSILNVAKMGLKGLGQLLSFILLLIGIYFSLIVLGVKSPYLNSRFWELLFPQLGIYQSVVFGSVTIGLLKAVFVQKHRIAYITIGIIGLIVTAACALPALSTPFAIVKANAAMAEGFGSNWNDQIDDQATSYFMQTPFALPQAFLGIRTDDYQVRSQVLYFNGTQSSFPVDENITLYFDVYMPLGNNPDLPGKNASIIRLHGGSWRYYDKGYTNQMQLDKYLAAQGYVVFDIQYGLNNSNTNDPFTPANVMGNFSRADMVRHIGNFTHYLAANAGQFGARTDIVFISGGSAGGNLACAVALAMTNATTSTKPYASFFSSGLTIKGLIPYYPANGFLRSGGVVSEFYETERLVGPDSPPCLIFQGELDGLVAPQISQRMKDAYEQNGTGKCAIILFPFAAHANDLFVFPSYPGIIFTYYLERFLYLCVNDKI
jgi:acetyl esterase/lipase